MNFEDELNEQHFSKIHLRVQKRNARKCITIIEGLYEMVESREKVLKKICRALKKMNNCSGVVKDDGTSKVIQMSGDQRETVTKFLIEEGLATEKQIVIHGF